MTRTTTLVLTLSLLLLGGAWLLSRSLTADVPVPPATQRAPPAAPQPSFEPGVVPAPRPPPPVLAVTSPPPEPEPEVARPAPVPLPPLPADLTPEQLEIENIAAQGLAQLKDERGGPANWRRAEKYFERCLVLAPEEERCKEGLHQARLRLGPKVNKLAFPLVPVQDAPPPDPEE